jgi:F-type H+-transporting ATPase subunit gamma
MPFMLLSLKDTLARSALGMSLMSFRYFTLTVCGSRRNAMDNAQKNASDMISSLQMKYNRGRQAAITNELVDIITGKFPIITHQVSCLKISFLGASAL